MTRISAVRIGTVAVPAKNEYAIMIVESLVEPVSSTTPNAMAMGASAVPP
ncbi:MAG: hypothetical protein ABGW98_21830 [Myxococcales bacterium]